MRERCGNSNHTSFHNYGGRGIAVCAEWKESFEAFARDMASTYDSGLTLERKDVNGGYGPGNCVWASPKEQSENTRRNVYFDTPAGRVIRREAVKLLGVRSSTFQMLEARGELPWARVEAM